MPQFFSLSITQKVAEEQLKAHSFYNKYFFMQHCTSSFTGFFRPYVIKIIGFDSGLMAVNWIPFRMAQNVMCHDLAKLQIILSCDLLTVLSLDWGFHNFAAQIKAVLLEAIFFDIQRKVELSAFLTLMTWSKQKYCIPNREILHSLKIVQANI